MQKTDSPKVIAMYDAVRELIEEGTDIHSLKVSDITRKAGIGKGTAYEYFSTKEELISNAIFYQIYNNLTWLMREMEKKEKFKEKIYAMLEHMEANHDRYHVLIRYLCYYVQEALEQEHILCQVKNYINNSDELRPFFEGLLKQAMKEGILENEIPYQFMASAAITQVMGYITYIGRNLGTELYGREVMKEIVYKSIVAILKTTQDVLS